METFLHAGYRLEKACCVDQFCQTVWTGGCGGICQGVIGMENKVERKKKFIINVVFYALIAVLVWVGCKYLVSPMMPFIIAFLVAARDPGTGKEVQGIKKAEKAFVYCFLCCILRAFAFAGGLGQSEVSGRSRKTDTAGSAFL